MRFLTDQRTSYVRTSIMRETFTTVATNLGALTQTLATKGGTIRNLRALKSAQSSKLYHISRPFLSEQNFLIYTALARDSQQTEGKPYERDISLLTPESFAKLHKTI